MKVCWFSILLIFLVQTALCSSLWFGVGFVTVASGHCSWQDYMFHIFNFRCNLWQVASLQYFNRQSVGLNFKRENDR